MPVERSTTRMPARSSYGVEGMVTRWQRTVTCRGTATVSGKPAQASRGVGSGRLAGGGTSQRRGQVDGTGARYPRVVVGVRQAAPLQGQAAAADAGVEAVAELRQRVDLVVEPSAPRPGQPRPVGPVRGPRPRQ